MRSGAAPFALLAAALAAGAAAGWAQEGAGPGEEGPRPVRLAYRFQRLAGRTATYSIEHEQRVLQRVQGRRADDKGGGEVVSWARQTTEQAFEASGEGAAGRVDVTPRRVEARVEGGGATARYDSATAGPQSAPDAFSTLAARVGKTVSLDVTALGEVTGVRGVKATERAAYLRTFVALPDRPLALGRGWERLEREPMAPFGTIAFLFRYALAEVTPGQDGAPDRYRVEATIRARLEDTVQGGTTQVELTSQDGRGRLVLDADGLLLESEIESHLELTIRSAAGEQVQRVRSRTLQRLLEVRPTKP